MSESIFSITGYRFQLNSNRDEGDALSRFITLTAKTKTGQYKMDEDTLAKIDHPLASLFVEYASLNKYATSYLDKMLGLS